MSILGSLSGVSKLANKLYAPMRGVAKEIQKFYGSESGLSKVVYSANKDVDYIEITFNATEEDAMLYNPWRSDIVVEQNGVFIGQATSGKNMSIDVSAGDVVRIMESVPGQTFRAWRSGSAPLFEGFRTPASITAMPSMKHFTEDAEGTRAGEYFFQGFCYDGWVSSLPAGSFDTSGIVSADRRAFFEFNSYGRSLESLPKGSFRFDSLRSVGAEFCASFNERGGLTELPNGSFDTSGLEQVGDDFLEGFNGYSTSSVGGLTRSTSKRTNTINKTDASITAWYKSGSSSASYTIAAGGNFNWKMSAD